MAFPGLYSQPQLGTSNQDNTYGASIAQSAGDYDELMKRYRDFIDNAQKPNSNLTALASQYQNQLGTNYTPEKLSYQQGPNQAAAMGNLNELSKTGGYSDQGIADLRARGISPIRAVYANAMQNINRQKSLQGGYSPNYTASMAKLARDLSESIAGQTSNVNAGIAQNVASNRLSAAPQYAQAAGQETNAINDVNARNQSAGISAAELNQNKNLSALSGLAGIYGNQQNQTLQGIQGMSSLYGTTPANPALYGQQAATAAELDLRKKQLNQQGSNSLINAYQSSFGSAPMQQNTTRYPQKDINVASPIGFPGRWL